ncbi:MAG: hypothetical protein CL842_09475 [Crocinitomicaceae bacterium]|nr:hypothetical protein [Crocinitomicaceae bacterium]
MLLLKFDVLYNELPAIRLRTTIIILSIWTLCGCQSSGERETLPECLTKTETDIIKNVNDKYDSFVLERTKMASSDLSKAYLSLIEKSSTENECTRLFLPESVLQSILSEITISNLDTIIWYENESKELRPRVWGDYYECFQSKTIFLNDLQSASNIYDIVSETNSHIQCGLFSSYLTEILKNDELNSTRKKVLVFDFVLSQIVREKQVTVAKRQMLALVKI